jgi:transcriptional regulator with XRE-family HTH domain
MPDEPTLGARIRKRRQELRLTQKQLAAKVGVDESSVINWEKDKHFPSRHLGALEDVLGTLTGPGLTASRDDVWETIDYLYEVARRARGGNGRPKAS